MTPDIPTLLPDALKHSLLSRIDAWTHAAHAAISSTHGVRPTAAEAHAAVNDLVAAALQAGYEAGVRSARGEDLSQLFRPDPVTQLRLRPHDA